MKRYQLPSSLSKLVQDINYLPGIGPKSATRIAIHLVQNSEKSNSLIQDLGHVVSSIKRCEYCNALSTELVCEVCGSEERSGEEIMILEHLTDLVQLEEAGVFTGKYFILGKLLSPLNGVSESDLPLDQLISQIERNSAKELIFALSVSMESEATILAIEAHVEAKLKENGLRFTKLARGLPAGAAVEYLDQGTLRNAVQNRTQT